MQADAQRREQERQALAQQAQAERAQREALQRQLEALNDPMQALAHLERVGLSPKVLAQKAVEANTPEAKLRAEIEARIEERVSAVQRAHEAELTKLREEREQRTRFEQIQQATNHFVAQASKATDYPAVSAVINLGPEWRDSIVAEARRVLTDAYQRTGYEYTNEEVLSYLETKYSKLVPSTPKDEAAKSNVGSAPNQEDPNRTGTQETQSAGGSRTLTNKATQLKGTVPPDFDSLSDKDQKAALAALYRASRKP